MYDFGFYLHNETRQGGYPEAFQWAVDTVQTLSRYYLLFGKQTDQSGVYTRFWVDSKLPETGEAHNDAKKWWFPGLVSLWVLQHYRNFDCSDKVPCYIPITNHEIQILHKISVCADVP